MYRSRLLALILLSTAVLCVVWSRGAQTQSPLRRVTNTTDEGININPSISGDSRFIGFESTEDVAHAGGVEHFRAIRANVSIDPPTFFQMGATRGAASGVSQDGSRVTWAAKDDPLASNADGNSEIFLFNGSNLVQITNTSPGDISSRIVNGNFQPSISDDGRFIAFSSNRNLAGQNADGNFEIFVYDSSAVTFSQLTNTSGTIGCTDAKISGNGAKVAFIRDTGTTVSARRDLMIQDRASGPATVLANQVQTLLMAYGRAISDDGLRVVYSADTATNSSQVFFFDGRSGNLNRQVTNLGVRTTEVPLQATISGDGKRIAFAARRAVTGFSNSDASVELYTYDIPTTTFGRVTSASGEADCFDGTSLACEVVSSLSDDGAVVAFSFPRALSGTVASGLENNCEIYVTGTAVRPPSGSIMVLNYASFGHEPNPVKGVAPNSIAVALGTALANTTLQSQRLPNNTFPTNVGGTTVTVNGRSAQIFFVSPTQVQFLVPPQTEVGAPAEVVVTNADGFSSRGNVQIFNAAPGIFTKSGDGVGQGMILDSDTLQEGPFDPSNGNLRLLIFTTGARNAEETTVNIGGRIVAAESVTASFDMPGLDEVRVRVPVDLRGAGTVNLSIQSDSQVSNPVTASFLGDPSRNVQINEVLADPPDGIAGDANHDGTRDSADDEFVELVNATSNETIGMGGWTIKSRAIGSSTETTRFTFASGTSLPPGEAIIVFGGGTANFNPSDNIFGCAQVFRATTSAGLSLTNPGLTVLLKDANNNQIATFTYGGSSGLEGDNNQSLTRSPDVTGAFVQHTAAAGANGRRYSPGLRVDGTPFGNCPSRLTSVTLTPASPTINVGQTQQFTAQAFDQFGRVMKNVNINFTSDNTTVATVDSISMDFTTGFATANVTGRNPGTAHITASAVDGSTTVNSSPATLTVTGPTLSINDVSQNEGDEESSVFTFTVSLSTPAPAPVTFNIATQNNTATVADNDYVARSLINQTIPTGQQTYTFDVTVNPDGNIEPNETFFVNVTNVSGAAVTDGQGLGTILTDDNPVLNVNDVSLSEGNGGTTTFTFTVTSTKPAPAPGITFNIATADDTAQDDNPASEDNDYVAKSLTSQTIPTGLSSYTFTVNVNGDLVIEPNETFFVNITNVSSNAVPGDVQGLGTIQTDDASLVVISQVYGGGNNSGATYKNDFIELFNRGTSSVDVAGWSVQQASATGTSWSRTDICPVGSCVIAPGKYFLVKEGPSSPTIGADLPAADATGTINIATGSGKIALVNNSTTLTGSGCPFGASIVDFVGYGNTADCSENNTDAPAHTNTTADFRKSGGCVDTNDNAADFVTATPNPRNSSSPANDCTTGFRPDISINDVAVTEGNAGTKTVDFTVSLSAPNATQTVTVNFATADGSANAGSDYQTNSGTVTFVPGDASELVTITINGDMSLESNETFFVNLSSPTNGSILDGQGVGTIQEDDSPPTLTIADVSLNEGNSGPTTFAFTVHLSAPALTGGVTFNIATADGTAQDSDMSGEDFDYVPQSLTGQTIPAGSQDYAFNVTVNGDLNIEPNETFLVNVTSVSGATVGDGTATGTIQNDDSPTLNIINDVSMTEGNSGTKIFTFTVTSTLPAPAGGITFDITTQDATAQDDNPVSEDNDYVANSQTGKTISVGTTQTTFDVTVNGDKLVENDETFNVLISNASGGGATIGDGTGVGTIQNDDTADLVISQAYGGGGNSGATFQNDFVEVFNQGTTTVDFGLTQYSVQYASSAGSFTASNKVNLSSGTLVPGQYFLIKLASTAAVGATFTADLTDTGVDMSSTNGKIALVAGTTLATTSAGGCPTGVTIADLLGYGSANCSETSPTAALSATKSALRKSDGCIDTDNNLSDFTTPTLSSGTPPRNSASALNDCNTPPNLSIDNVSMTEGNSLTKIFTFTVSLSKPALTGGVTFNIATQDDSATTANSDYVTNSATGVTIPAGSSSTTFDVTVNGDTSVESDETFFVNVTSVVGANVTDGQGVGTIQNDDTPSLSINDITQNEGQASTSIFTFTVTLSPASNQTVTVNYATNNGSATSGSDYTAISSTQLTFLPTETTKTVDVTVSGDTTVEPDETFTVDLSGNSPNSLIGDAQGVGTITNDDGATVVISQIYAGGGNSGAQYTNDFVELFNRTATAIDVSNWSVQTATATGTSWTVTRLCPVSQTCFIPAHGYYLIKMAAGATPSGALPLEDATGTTNFATTGGKAALSTNTTPLSGSAAGGPPLGGATCPNANLASVVDFVGFGNATCFEGAAAPALSNTTANLRGSSGCTDTNSNSANFATGVPTPRNSSSSFTCP